MNDTNLFSFEHVGHLKHSHSSRLHQNSLGNHLNLIFCFRGHHHAILYDCMININFWKNCLDVLHHLVTVGHLGIHLFFTLSFYRHWAKEKGDAAERKKAGNSLVAPNLDYAPRPRSHPFTAHSLCLCLCLVVFFCLCVFAFVCVCVYLCFSASPHGLLLLPSCKAADRKLSLCLSSMDPVFPILPCVNCCGPD